MAAGDHLGTMRSSVAQLRKKFFFNNLRFLFHSFWRHICSMRESMGNGLMQNNDETKDIHICM